MIQVNSDFTTGTITISEEYNFSASPSTIDATPYFNHIGDDYIISLINLKSVLSMDTFQYQTSGSLETRYLEPYYRVSRDGNKWTDYLTFSSNSYNSYDPTESIIEITNFIPFDPVYDMWVDIKFTRVGDKSDGYIQLLGFTMSGTLKVNEITSNVGISPGQEVIIRPPYIFKIFKISDLQVATASGGSLDISYRFSQDNSRTWSKWEPLTKENITTVRINPIRFFQIEYLVSNSGTQSASIIDINLIGDFQNVTLDSQKTNVYGIRECCPSTQDSSATSGYLTSDGCNIGNTLSPLTSDQISKLWNPYAQTQALAVLNKMSNDAVEIFGHPVEYFVTDPDGRGIDYSIHELGLFNIVCFDQIKVSVDQNQFPDNQIMMNQFDLSLFDSFEVHITKDSFKALFGTERRPSKEDLVYFCELNRLFIVDHAQQFRSFNNYAIYYKVVLKKYNKSANVIAGNKTVKDRISQLTDNSTIDELFGIENKLDKKSVANTPQLQVLTKDPIRVDIDDSLIVRGLIENSSTIISKQHYDFSTYLLNNGPGGVAVRYKNMNSTFKVSDNIGFMLWFNINNYIEDETYNFFNYYDSVNNLGWSVNLLNDSINVIINSSTYSFKLSATPGVSALAENVWYSYVLNVDQRNRQITHYIYKRNTDDESRASYLRSTALQLVYTFTESMDPQFYQLVNIDATILVSDLLITNIRLFTDIIPQDQHNKILNQAIIGVDSKYLVFGDNANIRLFLPNFPLNTE